MTNNGSERRREKRLNYHWPIWFAEDFNDVLAQGQMFDLSSSGAAFTCYSDACPAEGQYITTRFSIPHYGEDNSFDLESCMRSGFVCRIEDINPFMKKVALQFAEPLHFKPGEQSADARQSNRKVAASV
jgi:hypothetical protein